MTADSFSVLSMPSLSMPSLSMPSPLLAQTTAEMVESHWAYLLTIVLLVIGLYGMLLKGNLVKKLIGMNIFQGAIILFYVVYAFKSGDAGPASVPVHSEELGDVASAYMNPIPHGLMLTAIVVSVATTGVGLALLIRIYRAYGTLEERELLEKLRHDD